MVFMYSLENKQYILKQSNERIYNLYYDNRKGICYSILNKRNNWSESVSIQPKAHKLFYADIDSADNIHLLFQDLKGNIYISVLNNSSMKTIPILSSKSPNAYNKFLSLIPLKNTTHLFYVIKHNENNILTHHTLTNETVSTPKALDYVSVNNMPYSVLYDGKGTIYIFYQSSNGVLSYLGYKKYSIDQGTWSEFITITNHSDCEQPNALIDTKGIIHICYQRKSNNQYELIYQQKIPGKNICTPEIIIYRSVYPFENASICISNNNIVVFWVQDDIIYCSTSGNEGSTWAKPSKYAFNYSRQLFCMHYRSNNLLESSKFIANDVPGNYVNGFRLAFYPYNHVSTDNYLSSNDKNILFQNIQALKGNIDDFQDYRSEINDKIQRNINSIQDLSKELTKVQVRLSYLDNEINQIKSLIHNQMSMITEKNKAPEKPTEDIGTIRKLVAAEIEENKIINQIRNNIADLKAYIKKSNNNN